MGSVLDACPTTIILPEPNFLLLPPACWPCCATSVHQNCQQQRGANCCYVVSCLGQYLLVILLPGTLSCTHDTALEYNKKVIYNRRWACTPVLQALYYVFLGSDWPPYLIGPLASVLGTFLAAAAEQHVLRPILGSNYPAQLTFKHVSELEPHYTPVEVPILPVKLEPVAERPT